MITSDPKQLSNGTKNGKPNVNETHNASPRKARRGKRSKSKKNKATAQDTCPPIPAISAKRLSQHEATTQNGDKNASSLILENHKDFYSNPTNLENLEKGGVLFSFTCKQKLDAYETEMMDCCINLSCFENESSENYVPHINIHDDDDVMKYTFLLTRCAYILPKGIDLDVLACPKFMAKSKYHEACEPFGTVVWDDGKTDENTFRITKPIIPHVYSITIQFRVSRVKEVMLERLSRLVGTKVHFGLLLERTKRSKPPKEDSTRKAKSLLLYTKLSDGSLLVSHITLLVQSSLPTVIERILNKVGTMGLAEAHETAVNTRRYLKQNAMASN
mmetsp:Transcript_29002/g.43010  ORF Transcript_29002/g.43010 Transcript_29002/m.43010 type:complete len:331 (-) Transcript_29002:285-1277(-)|eukprot:CAMPEP_0195528952 /NCGR_PEP_ID=MMETSP0794_2-20130614/31317_1 /TAXON_ID=515487 /ORGANISM="Stephanopyxis turris, Strain CCMP 815" /LENGTH=330 /DNA_ID=CAMNT_0040660177 /DNA_START=186 /DNA_END=1178 /DNA_ORIENTATION=+